MSTLPEEIARHFGTNLAKPTFLGHEFRIVDDSEPDCLRETLELLIPGQGWKSWSWCALDENTLFRETYEAYEQGKIPPALTDGEEATLKHHGFSWEYTEGEVYAECKTDSSKAEIFKTCAGWQWMRGAYGCYSDSLEDAIAELTAYQEKFPLPHERFLDALFNSEDAA